MPVLATPIRPETEREDGVLGVAGVVDRRPVVGEDGEVGLSAELVVKSAQSSRVASARPPATRPPASARRPRCPLDRGCGPPAWYPRSEPLATRSKVTVVAEREPAGRVVERLRVGELEGREPRRSTEMDQHRGRLLATDAGSTVGVVAEGADVAVAAQSTVGADPGGSPAEARQAVALEPFGERPQLVDPERFGGPRDELLAHRRDDTRRRAAPTARPRQPRRRSYGARRLWISCSYSGK